jgi:hypothetical protein
MKPRLLAVACTAILAATSLSGCFGGTSDDCDSNASATVQTLTKPGGGSGGGGKGGGGAKGGAKGGSKTKSKPKKDTNKPKPVKHNDTDDCDEDD